MSRRLNINLTSLTHLALLVLPGPMSTPPEQPRGVTEDEEEEKEDHRETLKDGDTPQKDSTASAVAETSRSGKDSPLQADAGKTTGTGQ